jgi:hypothetical protein
LPDNSVVNAQEILISQSKRQPEPALRDVLRSREVEQQKPDILHGK